MIPDWVPWRVFCWITNWRIRRLCARHPDKFVIVGGEDGLLDYEHTPWWAHRRKLIGLDD